MDDLESNFK